MKLSTKSRYAIMALLDMIERGPYSVSSLVSIAERQNLPLPYLEQIFLKLRKKSIVSSARGFYGGYRMKADEHELSIYDIVTAVDDPTMTLPCQGVGNGCIPHGAKCLTHQLFAFLDNEMIQVLKKITLYGVYENVLGHKDPLTQIVKQDPVIDQTAEQSMVYDTDTATQGCVYESL